MNQNELLICDLALPVHLSRLEVLSEAGENMENVIFYTNHATLWQANAYHQRFKPILRGADVRNALVHSIHQLHQAPEHIRAVFHAKVLATEQEYCTQLTMGNITIALFYTTVRDSLGQRSSFLVSWQNAKLAESVVNHMSNAIVQGATSLTDSAKENVGSMDEASGDFNDLGQSVTENCWAPRGSITEFGTISCIAQTIQEVDRQTDMLALDASIEAARVDERGHGSAAVSDVVRNRSKQVQEATEEVLRKIPAIKDFTKALEEVGQIDERKTHDAKVVTDSVVKQITSMSTLPVGTMIKFARNKPQFFVWDVLASASNLDTESMPTQASSDHHQHIFSYRYDDVSRCIYGQTTAFVVIKKSHSPSAVDSQSRLGCPARGVWRKLPNRVVEISRLGQEI